MRFPLLASFLFLLPGAAGAGAANLPAAKDGLPTASRECPRATSHYAYKQGGPLKPRKLTELPRGRAYMAVYRVVDGCEDPMTMVEYRAGEKR